MPMPVMGSFAPVVVDVPQVSDDGDQPERDEDHRCRDQPPQQPRFHVIQVGPLDEHHRCAQPDEQQYDVLRGAAHRLPPSNTDPTSVATTVATTNVAGPNRTANRGPNRPACIADSFTSTAGPTTRNTSRGSSGSMVRLAATNASASEHSASATVSTPTTRWPARCWNSQAGTSTRNVAAAAAPRTR